MHTFDYFCADFFNNKLSKGMKYRIYRPKKLSGRVHLPPSKSLCNRALILNALSGAPLGYLTNISDCDDTLVILEALFLLDAE